MRARFPWSTPLSDEDPEIAPLTADVAHDLRLPWLSRFNGETLVAQIEANPGKALWVPRTGEYVVAERWRHRDEIAQIVEVTARKGKAALLHELNAHLRADGVKLALVAEEAWNDQPRVYTEVGFALIEKIVFFQRDLKALDAIREGALPTLEYRMAEHDDLDVLLDVDHKSFPWMWWNSREDMIGYMETAGVSIYLARAEGEPVGYASFTMYNGWAHLDRLAVIEAQQGRKYGAAQLTHTMKAMATQGATHLGLSTQENNVQSHRLYRGFEFKQTKDSMNIYGMSLEE